MDEVRALGGRYRFVRRLSAGPPCTIWLTEDQQTGRMAVATLLSHTRSLSMQPGVGVAHPHLATLFDLVDSPAREELPAPSEATTGVSAGVAEWVPGTTIYELLAEHALAPAQAVRTVLALASALRALHDAGAVHGAVSTRSIVVERADDAPGPTLTQVAIAPDGSFCSPERIRGGGPSEHDDTWALHVVLYNALTARRPFRARSREALARVIRDARPLPLAAFQVQDDVLQEILTRGLSPYRAHRAQRVAELEQALGAWLANEALLHPESVAATRSPPSPPVSPDATESAAISAFPAPLSEVWTSRERSSESEPPDAVQAASSSPEPPPPESSPVQDGSFRGEPSPEDATAPPAAVHDEARVPSEPAPRPTPRQKGPVSLRSPMFWVGVLAVAAVTFAGGATLTRWYQRQSDATGTPAGPPRTSLAVTYPAPPPALAPAAIHTQSAATAPAASTGSSALPPTSTVSVPPGPEDATTCAKEFFPADTFRTPQDLRFVCDEADPRQGAAKVRGRVVAGRAGALTPAMKEWSQLGWHDLPMYAAIRYACCEASPGVRLPEPAAGCPDLSVAVNKLARDVASAAPVGDALDAFHQAAECAFRHQKGTYPYPAGPISGGQVVFAQAVGRTSQRRARGAAQADDR